MNQKQEKQLAERYRKIKTQRLQALNTYIGQIQAASQLLADLTEYIEDHGNVSPDDVNFGHVESMGHVIELLKEAHQFVGLS